MIVLISCHYAERSCKTGSEILQILEECLLICQFVMRMIFQSFALLGRVLAYEENQYASDGTIPWRYCFFQTKRRSQMTEQEKKELLRIYINDTFRGFIVFSVFVAGSILCDLVARVATYFGIPMLVGIFRLIAWIILAFGAISLISYICYNTLDYIFKLRGEDRSQEAHKKKENK
jgi:hypothetical protein